MEKPTAGKNDPPPRSTQDEKKPRLNRVKQVLIVSQLLDFLMNNFVACHIILSSCNIFIKMPSKQVA